MPAQSSMEGLAKIMAVGSIAKGGVKKLTSIISGDERLSKKMKKRAAKEKADQQRKILADEREEHKNWLRDNGSMLQAIKDRAWGWRSHLTEEQQAYKDNKAFDKEAKKQKKLEGRQRRAGFVSGMSTEEWAEQAAYTEATDRANLAARDIEDRKKDIEQRRAAQADAMTLDAEGKELDNEYVAMGRERLLALIENKEFDEEQASIQKEFNDKQKAALSAFAEPDLSEPPSVVPSEDLGPGGGGGADVVAAIEELTITTLDTNDLLVKGFGIQSPPFLERILKETEGAPSIIPESIGTDSAPDVGTPDVSMEALTDGEPMVIMSDQIAELIQIEKDELDFDRRREAREIKAERRALEDRRDKKSQLGQKLGLGGKKPDKQKKKSGLLDTLMKFGGKYLLGMVSGWVGLKTALGLSTKADDAARAAKVLANATTKADEAAKITKNIATKSDDVARALGQTDEIAKVGTKVDDAVKPLSKIDDVANATKTVTTKVDDAVKVGAKSAAVADDFVKVGTKIDDGAAAGAKGAKLLKVGDAVTDVGTTATKIAGGVKATNVAKLSTSIDSLTSAANTLGKTEDIAKVGTKVDDVAKGIQSIGGKVDDVAKGVKGVNAAVNASKGAGVVSKVTTSVKNVATGLGTSAKDATAVKVDKATKAGVQILSKGAKPITDTVKTVVAVTKTAGKLATRVGKVLAPLDLLSKMHQGQGFWESLGNMGLEIGQLAVGGADWLAEKATGGEGFMEAKGSETMFQDADILGNKDKWQTSLLEQGINKGVAAYTGTEQVANKKVYTDEQKATAKALEDAGVVDLGLGPGDIDDLEELSLLDEKSLQALLDYQVWDDEDMAMITKLRDAKQQGVSVQYDDMGWAGKETVKFGSLNPEDDGSMAQPVPGAKTTPVQVISNALTQEQLVSSTPNVVTQDKMALDATTPGSIFTHDTHLEQTLWTIWEEEKTLFGTKPVGTTDDTTVGIEGAPPQSLEMVDNMMPVPVIDVSPNKPVFADVGPKIPSEVLAQVISQISTMEKQATTGTQAGAMVQSNVNQNIDNSVRTNNIPASTVFAPASAMPAGIGTGA